MPYEEDQLSRIAEGAAEMDAHEAARHARYAAEDADTAARRQREDDLHASGVASREKMKADIEAAIKQRDAEAVAKSPETMEALMARIAHLEDVQKAAAEAPVVTPPKA